MSTEPLKTLTDIHKKVIKRLERLGIQLMEEVRFPPYTVDIYIPDAHLAVEVDGPHHKKKKDDKRDKYLYETYNLPTVRLTLGESKKAHLVKEIVQDAIKKWIETADWRFNEIKERVPWL